jgi:hypothetical protein
LILVSLPWTSGISSPMTANYIERANSPLDSECISAQVYTAWRQWAWRNSAIWCRQQCNLKNLEVSLTLPNNHLQDKWWSDWELIIYLSSCIELFYLSLSSSNDFHGVFPPSLVNHLSTSLQKLHVADNKIHGAVSSDIWRLSNLAILNLRGNLLTD